MAPPKWRGRLNTTVQLGTISGIVIGTGINVGASFLEWGWRIPLSLAAVPGSILLLGMHAPACSECRGNKDPQNTACLHYSPHCTLCCAAGTHHSAGMACKRLHEEQDCQSWHCQPSLSCVCCTKTMFETCCLLGAGGLFLPETPNSLVERGFYEKGKAVLQKVRGTDDVELEYSTIVVANEAVKGSENPWISICRRRNRPQLALAILNPFFQQWSGEAHIAEHAIRCTAEL